MIAIVLLAQLASATPARLELANGLRVWVQEDHSRPVALVQVTYDVGSLHETDGTTGIAHYVEHMVYRATANIRNEDIYGYIDRIGGRYTGGTWPNFTRYAETVPSWALEAALRVTAERMSRALFDSLEFERERNNVVTEANGFREADAPSALRDSVLTTAFEQHPYRHSSNTWARDNLRLTRAEAFDWYRRYYGPNNAVLVVVGDVVADSVKLMVERHFGSLPRATNTGEIRIVEPLQRAERRVTLRHAGTRTNVEIAYRAPSAHDADYPVLVAVNRLLTPALARVARAAHGEIVARDSATSYPFLYRISFSADSTVDPEKVIAEIDREIDALRTTTAVAMAGGPDSARSSRTGDGETTNLNFPARQSSLTRIANRLSSRDQPAWEVSDATMDTITARARSVNAAEIRAFVGRWLRPEQRTIGVLLPGSASFAEQLIDVPPLRTPPAKRMQPDSVPSLALTPLAPISIEHTRRVLANGIPVRTARVRGDAVALRLVIERANALDTLVRAFAVKGLDSALAAAAVEVSTMRGEPAPKADTSLSARARERLLDDLTPRSTARATARRITVSAAGPLAPAQLAAAIERHFRGLGRNSEPALPAAITARHTGGAPIRETGARQVIVEVGLPGVPRGHPDQRALELLNYIVGVPWYGGRLGWALTKSGLTYSSAAQTTSGLASGRIRFSTVCDTRNSSATVQAISEVIEGIGQRGVEEWELREAKAFTLGRMLLYGAREQSQPDVVALALSNSEDLGLDLLDLPAFSRAYLSVTLADINRVAREYYRPEKLSVVTAGAVPSGGTGFAFPRGTFRALFEP